MKKCKWLVVTITLLLAASLCLSACGNNASDSGDSPPETSNGQPNAETPVNDNSESPASTVRLTMATGGTGGTYYPFGGALAMAVDSATGYIKINVNATGASAENIQQIGAGQAHLAIVQNDVMDYAYNASNTWTGDPVTGMTTLMSLYPEVCQIIASADSGIESVADLAGKRVSTGDIGSGVEANAIQILDAYGMSVADINQQHLSFNASADAMKDRRIDAFFVTAGVPNTAVMDLQTSRAIKIINIDDNIIDSLIAQYPFYAKVTLTDADYSFLAEPVNTVAVKATLIATPDLEDQVAYDIVKSIIENQESITTANAKGAYISPENAVEGISVAFHPGSLRYFTEIGAIKG